MICDAINCYENISCSWAPTVPESVVVFGEASDPKEWDEDGGIAHVINEENFIFLEKVDDQPCSLHIKLKDNLTQITNVSVVSEARILEIYGKYGEYIKTCKCELISEANGINYYAAQTDLLTTQEITIKFPVANEGMWLCGVKLLTRNAPPSITNSFDYNLVDDKLKKSNIPITEKAEKFKKFLQDYATNRCNSAGMDPQMLLRMMEVEAMSHPRNVENASRSYLTKYLTSLIPSPLNPNKNDTEASQDVKDETKDKDSEVPSPNTNSSSLKTYVDESLEKLEERLQGNFKKQLEELEAKQNEKLDTILSLLKNSALR